ncbi:hypothetical protein SAMN04487819_1184 [Actinopolyspora alba]|uniref:CAAX prenyl protease 2/Lysostaphin resistance protein A-like domain-containing protein n=1 Tax=Actinopolyspora alba TaxID=673379 RepID=A0A1I2BXD0_9ACTN|nr:type II CAAX endopeptidase family protein [Actinopolyspora alba]SFE60622.1 hypothetical protein SAMN04487819_1184 [Actinopolyspora alba]
MDTSEAVDGATRPASPLLRGILRARRPTGAVVGILVVLGCFVLGQIVSAIAFAMAVVLTGDLSVLTSMRLGLASQVALTCGFIGSVLGLVLWLPLKEGRPFGSVGFLPARNPVRSASLGAGVALLVISVLVLGNVAANQLVLESSGAGYAIVGVLVLTLLGFVVQASTEEILTRGYLMQVTWRKWGLTAALVAQAVVFTLLHGLNTGFGPLPLLNLLLISFVLAFWALAEGGLWGVCAFHTVWNWCQGNVYGVEVSGMNLTATLADTRPAEGGSALLNGGAFGIEGGLPTTAVLLCLLVIAVLAYRRRRSGFAAEPTRS